MYFIVTCGVYLGKGRPYLQAWWLCVMIICILGNPNLGTCDNTNSLNVIMIAAVHETRVTR